MHITHQHVFIVNLYKPVLLHEFSNILILKNLSIHLWLQTKPEVGEVGVLGSSNPEMK